MFNGTLSSLWRYPVKSMAGEELEQAQVTAAGLAGDRAYALIDAWMATSMSSICFGLVFRLQTLPTPIH